MTVRLWSVEFDANDRVALARFWAAALGWERSEAEGYSSISGGRGTLRRLGFVTEPNDKRSANWAHFDLSSRSIEDQQATVARLIGLGARRIDIGQGPDCPHVVLADPEGNEFCVLEPGNTFVDYGGLLGSLTCVGSPAAGYFWGEALGWPLVWDQGGETAIRSPDGGQFLTFGGPLAAPKRGKNRLHIDVAPPADGDQQAEVERLLAIGARHADIGQGEVAWVVMADPDGNELCVLTPR
jgi:catechol 2,3-dioxygenase-like lactoylglutathione lyase family enzyme/predicted enzyme related to lactoylglutathione lyase